ncbi:hypothetical protein ACQ4PT_012186 [Festuca glaucescens]
MGNALAIDGGFCTGSARVVDHQRLSSSGYVFSNSLAPYLVTAAVSAVNYLEENSSVLSILRTNVALLHKGHTLTTTWAASHAATLMNFSTSIDAPMVEEGFVILGVLVPAGRFVLVEHQLKTIYSIDHTDLLVNKTCVSLEILQTFLLLHVD